MKEYVRVAGHRNHDFTVGSHLYYDSGSYLAEHIQYMRICRTLGVSPKNGLDCCDAAGEWHTVLEMP